MTPAASSSASADVHQRCLDEATRLFVEHGYHGISMREIAEQVGMSKAGLYYHFKDKEALFLAILTANIEQIEAIIQAACAEETSTRARIARILREIGARAPAQSAIIRLASQELSQLSPQARQTFVQQYHEKFTGQIEIILAAGVSAGELRPVDARLATWILLGMMYPFFYPANNAYLAPADQAIELMVSIFFDGVAGENDKGTNPNKPESIDR